MYQLSLCLLHERTFHLFFKSALCEEHFYPKCFRVMGALWFLAQMGPNNESPDPSVQHGVKRRRHKMARRRDRQAFTPTADSPGNRVSTGNPRRGGESTPTPHRKDPDSPHHIKKFKRTRKGTCSN